MIINMNGGGGGGSGATLVVNSSGTGVVTVSNAQLGKSYSKSVTLGGSVAFKGLATGTWTVTLSNGSQTTTQTVNITADYSVAVAYFAATINITYPEGSICTATDGVSTFTAPDTSGTWTLVVPNVGEWTVTITDPTGTEEPASETVTITADGQSTSVTVDYAFYLYKDGNEYTSITGGWTIGFSEPSSNVFTKGESSMILQSRGNANGGGNMTVATVNKIPLAGYAYLEVDVNYDVLSGSNGFEVGLKNSRTTAPFEQYVAIKEVKTDTVGTLRLAISSYASNSYYVYVGVTGYVASNKADAEVFKLRLVKE